MRLLRAVFQRELELRRARRLGHDVSVVALDLDRLKVINDTLGRDVGDALLRQLATRLLACIREDDLVARAGGEEFTIIATRTDTSRAIGTFAQRVLDTVAQPCEIDGREVLVSASVGVARSTICASSGSKRCCAGATHATDS